MGTGSTEIKTPPSPQKEIGQQYAQLMDETEGLASAWRNLKTIIDPVLGPGSEVKTADDNKKNPQSAISPLASEMRVVRYLLHDLKLDLVETLERIEL